MEFYKGRSGLIRTHTRLCLCLVQISMAFVNQWCIYACVTNLYNYGKGIIELNWMYVQYAAKKYTTGNLVSKCFRVLILMSFQQNSELVYTSLPQICEVKIIWNVPWGRTSCKATSLCKIAEKKKRARRWRQSRTSREKTAAQRRHSRWQCYRLTDLRSSYHSDRERWCFWSTRRRREKTHKTINPCVKRISFCLSD